jgi:pilus assembly protein CpaB
VDVIGTLLFVDLDTDFQAMLPNQTGVVIASGPPDPESQQNNPLTVAITSLSQEGLPDPETGQTSPPFPISPGIFGKVVIDPVLGQAVYLVPSEKQRPRMVSQMVLQNCIVLQIGDFPLEEELQATPTPIPQEQAPNQGQPTEEPPAPKKPVVITLIVNPQDAIGLNYMIYSGAQLTLTLRNPNDNERLNRDAVTLQYLLENYQIPIPVKLPYGVQPRIDDLIQPTPPPQDQQ